MILKAATRDHSSCIGNEGWLFLDRVAKVQTHGYVTLKDGSEADRTRISCSRDELRAWVDQAWGTERDFDDEFWPEFESAEHQHTVECVHITRDDGSMVLALLMYPAYLLSETGKTIDRLR